MEEGPLVNEFGELTTLSSLKALLKKSPGREKGPAPEKEAEPSGGETSGETETPSAGVPVPAAEEAVPAVRRELRPPMAVEDPNSAGKSGDSDSGSSPEGSGAGEETSGRTGPEEAEGPDRTG